MCNIFFYFKLDYLKKIIINNFAKDLIYDIWHDLHTKCYSKFDKKAVFNHYTKSNYRLGLNKKDKEEHDLDLSKLNIYGDKINWNV